MFGSHDIIAIAAPSEHNEDFEGTVSGTNGEAGAKAVGASAESS